TCQLNLSCTLASFILRIVHFDASSEKACIVCAISAVQSRPADRLPAHERFVLCPSYGCRLCDHKCVGAAQVPQLAVTRANVNVCSRSLRIRALVARKCLGGQHGEEVPVPLVLYARAT